MANVIMMFLYYIPFASLFASFIIDFSRVKKPFFILAIFLSTLLMAVVRVLLGDTSTLYISLFLAGLILVVSLELIFLLKPFPFHIVLYAFLFTLEFAIFITANSLLGLLKENPLTPYYYLRFIPESTVLIILVRKFITPLAREYTDTKAWYLLSLSLLLGSIGFYIIFVIRSYYIDKEAVLFGGLCVLFLALMAGNYVAVYVTRYMLKGNEAKAELANTNKLLELQKEQYQNMADLMKKTDEIRHDFRHQAVTMSALLEEGKTKELSQYLHTYTNDIPSRIAISSNPAVNAIFSYYYGMAKSKGIQIDYKIDIPDGCSINDSDFTVLIGNCMENAIEASLRIPKEERKIKLWGQVRGDFLFLVFENNYDGNCLEKNGQILSTKRNGKEEGIGLLSVKRIVKQYQGEMLISHPGKAFSVKVSIKFR